MLISKLFEFFAKTTILEVIAFHSLQFYVYTHALNTTLLLRTASLTNLELLAIG